MALITTQPVNITGVTLSNPTGAIGNYSLSYIIASLKKGSWKYNGTVYSGSILTVGSGKDYAYLKEALDAIINDDELEIVLILITGDGYIGNITVSKFITNKTIFIRGTGASYIDTKITVATSEVYYFYNNTNIYFENITLIVNDWRMCIPYVGDSSNLQIFINKCNLIGDSFSGYFGYCVGSTSSNLSGVFTSIKNSSLGNGGIYAHFVNANMDNIICDKVLFNAVVGGSSPYGYLSSGTIQGDYATTPTVGYGSDYGSLLITDWIYLDEKTLSWGSGELVEIPTDGDYTLSDGTNTITATVDYSELPATNQSDTITISCYDRYWVGGSGLWTDTAHWALTSGGTGGNAAPTINDDVYIDENSFSTAGQIIKVT